MMEKQLLQNESSTNVIPIRLKKLNYCSLPKKKK